ncbi:MAG: hypothetical protein P8M25_03935 [Paracoccaceae bacterium]|nr:hypothetical protein [Paracoccaceae bacterium]
MADNDETGVIEVVGLSDPKAAYEKFLNWIMSFGVFDSMADVIDVNLLGGI